MLLAADTWLRGRWRRGLRALALWAALPWLLGGLPPLACAVVLLLCWLATRKL